MLRLACCVVNRFVAGAPANGVNRCQKLPSQGRGITQWLRTAASATVSHEPPRHPVSGTY
ncbi:MAG TPA: hypothetical protein VMU04_09900 [Candidatus Acidoferrum sp.]|nr:hypothetical protein [Candidatus Acidoferrum sp.]